VIALVASVLAASLLGSVHCAGMCGGFVCFFAGQGGARPSAHVAYHLGRLASYVALGALAGALGAGLDRWGAGAGVARVSAVLAGALMIGWGAATLAQALGARVAWLHGPRALRVPLVAAMRALSGRPPVERALALGGLTTLLPCGWLYAFVATASGTGSAWAGVVVMAAFWAGTVPILVGVGAAAQHAFGPLRRRLPAMTAATLMVLGVFTAAGKFHPAKAADGTATCHSTSVTPGATHGHR